MSAESKPWIQEFFEHVLSPSAVGDFVLTVLGAAIAFMGAVWLFRRQLRHDRDLFREQVNVERDSRKADMRRGAGRKLGENLIAASLEFAALTNDDLYELVVQHGFQAVHGLTPGAKRVYKAHQAASYELDLDDGVVRIWSAKLQWWSGVQALLADTRLANLSTERRKAMIYNLVESRFLDLDELLSQLGTALIRWDGNGEIPTIREDQRPESLGRRRFQVVSQVLDEVLRQDAERPSKKSTGSTTRGPAHG